MIETCLHVNNIEFCIFALPKHKRKRRQQLQESQACVGVSADLVNVGNASANRAVLLCIHSSNNPLCTQGERVENLSVQH